MKSLSFLSTLSGVVLLGSTCSPVMYAPNAQHVPSLRGKGDTSVEAYYAGTYDAEGLGFGVANAVSDKDGIGLTANFLWDLGYEDAEGKGNYFEGYYIRYGDLKADEKLMWAVNAGIGYGSVEWSGTNEGDISANILKPFIQPSVSLVTQYFEGALSARFAYVNYMNESYSFEDPEYQQSARNFFADKSGSIVFEPALTLRGGFRNVKLQIQTVYSTFRYDDYEPYNDLTSTIGFQFLFTEWFNEHFGIRKSKPAE